MNASVESGKTVWLNGRFMSINEARISPLDRGFLYGDGFFETIRAEKGTPLYPREHLERLHASLSAFRIALDPVPDWDAVVSALLKQNGLTGGVSSVKILVTRGIASPQGLAASEQPTVCVFANEYIPPPPEGYEKGWDLHLFNEGYAPPLAAHKSLNYLYYLAARQSAFDASCREAILMDRNGQITETSAGSLLARTAGQWWTPTSAHLLPGITIREICSMLLDSGTYVERRPARPQELMSAETVWVLNSLIGIMPVARIDGIALVDPAPGEASLMRERLFARGRGSKAACI